MKRITLLFVIVFTLMFTAACGNSAPAATQVPLAQPVVTEAPTEAVMQPEATQTSMPESMDGKVQVTVTEGDNWIKSDITTFKVGVPYVFTITNTGRRGHIFSISTPVPDKSQSGIQAAAKSALVLVTDQQLSPGSTVTVEYTFTEPAPAGTLEFACLIPMHYRMGQMLPIVVE